MNMTKLIEAAQNNTTIITPNKRLARELKLRYAQYALDEGKTAWEAPTILPLRAFVAELWQQQWDFRPVLSVTQERLLIEKIVNNSEHAQNLLSTRPAIRLAHKALMLSTTYDIDIHDKAFADHTESDVFQRWQAELAALKQEKGVLSDYDLIKILTPLIASKQLRLPDAIIMVGFIEITPIQTSFIEAITKAGTNIALCPSNEDQKKATNLLYDREEGATRAVIQEIKEALAAHTPTESVSAPRIAIIVDNLHDAKHQLEPILREYLAPNTHFPATDARHLPWEFTKGMPLADHELISSALLVLSLKHKRNPLTIMTSFLLNERVGNMGIDRTARSMIDYTLRDRGIHFVPLKMVQTMADKQGCPSFAERISAIDELIYGYYGDKALPSVWVERFEKVLSASGWPGTHTLSSIAYQALENFQLSLQALHDMDAISDKINYADALALLREIISDTLFMPRLSYQAPVQIVDMWEAPAMRFDKAFVIGLNADVLPRKPAPNPFVPLSLQVEKNVPDSRPEVEEALAAQLLSELACVANEVKFVSSALDSKGIQITPCPLAGTWSDPINTKQLLQHETYEKVACTLQNEPIIAVSDDELSTLRGGVSILGAYAHQPLYAFIEARLGVKPFPEPTQGLDRRIQGELIHSTLEYFWEQVQTQETLLSQTDDERRDLIDECIQRALNNPKLYLADKIGKHLLSLEAKRIKRLVKRWLKHEAMRDQPFKVIAREIAVESNIAGLPIKLRIDRIDEIHDGDCKRNLILDYKTGSRADPSNWSPESLNEPQLPIYASQTDLSVLNISAVEGIGFAHITEGACLTKVKTSWTGNLLDRDSKRLKAVSCWDGLIHDWQVTLEQNATGFLNGDLELDISKLAEQAPIFGYLSPLIASDN